MYYALDTLWEYANYMQKKIAFLDRHQFAPLLYTRVAYTPVCVHPAGGTWTACPDREAACCWFTGGVSPLLPAWLYTERLRLEWRTECSLTGTTASARVCPSLLEVCLPREWPIGRGWHHFTVLSLLHSGPLFSLFAWPWVSHTLTITSQCRCRAEHSRALGE